MSNKRSVDIYEAEQLITKLWANIKTYSDALNTGLDLVNGKYGPAAEAYAYQFFEYCAKNDIVDAMYELGMCYRWGDGGVYADPDQALSWFKKAADLGNEKAAAVYEQFSSDNGKMIMLGSAISGINGYGSKWYKSKIMVDQYQQLAENGDAEAQYELARQLADTSHYGAFKYDIEKAVYWYTKSGDNGVIDAMFNLAKIYFSGSEGFEPDKEKAKHWFEKCANAGDKEAAQLLIEHFGEE